MGSWNETCGITQLPILDGDPVVLFFLTKVPSKEPGAGHCYSTDIWTPRFIQIYGKYDDYGRIAVDDPHDWNIKWLVDHLKSDIVPLKQGENEYHDLAVVPDELTFEKIQELIDKNRLFIRVCPMMRSIDKSMPELTIIGSMMVHRFVFDEMVNSTYDHFRSPITLQSIIDDGYKWCTELKEKDNDDPIIRSMLRSNLRHQLNNVFGQLANYGEITISRGCVQEYISHLFDMVIEDADQKDIDKYITELSKFYMFDIIVSAMRKTYAPQAGKGSQSQEYNLYAKIAKITLEHANKRQSGED